MDNDASWLCLWQKGRGLQELVLGANDTIVVALRIDVCLDEIFSPCGHRLMVMCWNANGSPWGAIQTETLFEQTIARAIS